MLNATYVPRHRVRLYRRNNSFFEEDITEAVTSVNTSKKYGFAAGGFSLGAVAETFGGQTLDRYISPNDVILIELDGGGGGGFKKVMLGLVDRSAKNRRMDPNGTPERKVRILGKDFGKMLLTHDCGWDIAQLDEYDGSAETIRQLKAKALGSFFQYSGTPYQNLRSILDNLFFGQVGEWVQRWMDADGIVGPILDNLLFGQFGEWVQRWMGADGIGEYDDWVTWSKTIMERSGTIWQVMKSFADEPWNVLSTDTTDEGRFRIYLRRYPFHEETGKLTLETLHQVKDFDITHESIGRSDADLKNFASFEAYAPAFGQEGFAYMMAKTIEKDKDLVEDYGFRPFRPATEYVPPYKKDREQNVTESPDTIAAIRRRTKALFNWHRRAHEYFNGNLIIHGRPEIRAGEGLLRPEEGMEFFIEDVFHQYAIHRKGRSYGTVLHVTRGQDHVRKS